MNVFLDVPKNECFGFSAGIRWLLRYLSMRPPAFPSLYAEIYARKRPNPSFYEAVRQQWEASSLARAEKTTANAPVKAGQLRPSKAIFGAGGILL